MPFRPTHQYLVLRFHLRYAKHPPRRVAVSRLPLKDGGILVLTACLVATSACRMPQSSTFLSCKLCHHTASTQRFGKPVCKQVWTVAITHARFRHKVQSVFKRDAESQQMSEGVAASFSSARTSTLISRMCICLMSKVTAGLTVIADLPDLSLK